MASKKKGIAKEIIIWQQSVYVFSIESDPVFFSIFFSSPCDNVHF